MHCRACGYDVAGLPAGPCPECGRRFDPADRRTFKCAPTRDLSDCRLVSDRAYVLGALGMAALAWVPAVLEHVCLVVARLQIGRWPNRMGADDPKESLGAFFWLAWAWVVSLLLVLALFPVLLCLLGAFGLPGRWRLFLVLVPIAVVIYIGAFAFMRWDPAQAGTWLMD